MRNVDDNGFKDELSEFELNSMKEDWLKKEIDVKNHIIDDLKSKTKYNKIFSLLKILITIIFVVIEIFVAIYVLKKYGFIEKDFMESEYEKSSINIPIVDINKQLTMEYVNDLIKQMDKYKEDKTIKQILIVMNCPGGSPVAADEFTAYIKDYNKTKKINMYVQTMAASGGYYIASGIKPIVANPNAIVGSIGVIMPKYTIKKLADKIGVEEDNVVVGEYKVPASLFNNVTNEQKEYLNNNMLLPTYKNFIEVVSSNRGIDSKKIEEFAQGKIFIANKIEIKDILVDRISNYVEFKNELIDSISKEYKTNKDDIKFIVSEEKKEKLPFFNIKLDLSNLIQNSNLNLQ